MKNATQKLFIAVAVVAAIAAGCVPTSSSLEGTTPDCPLTNAKVFVTTSDFSVGTTAVLYGNPPYACWPQAIISSDSAAEVFGSTVYIVNRWGFDNIQALDANNGYQTINQFSVGNGSNPQDIVVYGGKAFVSLLQDSRIWVGDPVTGQNTGYIDLSAYADADGMPEAARMIIIDNRLFVALQRLDQTNWFTPTDKSQLAIINADTNAVVQVIDLAGKNPVTRLVYDPGVQKLYIGCAGAFGVIDAGGLEAVSIDTGTDTYASDGILINETALGGDLSALDMVSDSQAYGIVSDAAWTNHVVRMNPSLGQVGVELYNTSAYLPDLIIDGDGLLYVADRSFAVSGVKVWDTASDSLVGIPLGTGLPPYSLTLMP